MTREETIELKAAVGRLMYSDNKDIARSVMGKALCMGLNLKDWRR